MALPPTLHQEKITLILSSLRQWRPKRIQRSGHGGDNDTIDGSELNHQSTSGAKWRGGGLRGDDTTRDEDMHTTIK